MPDGKQTGIRDPNAPGEDPKWFSFDHSYWSHDGYKENASGYLEPIDDRYADQVHVLIIYSRPISASISFEYDYCIRIICLT